MAFTLRPSEEQEKNLEKLMSLMGESTKAKAIFALAAKAEYLIKREEKLTEIEIEHWKIKEAKEKINELI